MTDGDLEQLVADAVKEFVDTRRNHLIVESGPYYVQLAAIYPDGIAREREDSYRPFWELYAEHGLYAEAVSDENLAPHERLGVEGIERLTRLGWAPPGQTPTKSQNWVYVFELSGPTDCTEVARLVITTFLDGFEVNDPLQFVLGHPIEA
jgi:hypothetical protein